MEIDKKILFDELKNKSLNGENINYLLNLYKTYSLVEKYKENDRLKKYENKIYKTSKNDYVLSDIEKIKISLALIEKKMSSYNASKDVKSSYEELFDDIKYLKNYSNDEINYIKKDISLLQSKLNMDNTFLEEAAEVFENEYSNIYTKYIKGKK